MLGIWVWGFKFQYKTFCKKSFYKGAELLAFKTLYFLSYMLLHSLRTCKPRPSFKTKVQDLIIIKKRISAMGIPISWNILALLKHNFHFHRQSDDKAIYCINSWLQYALGSALLAIAQPQQTSGTTNLMTTSNHDTIKTDETSCLCLLSLLLPH